VDTRPAFQFESDTVADPVWVRVRVWLNGELREEGELYEIGEPVMLGESSLLQPKDHVYWIRDIGYEGPKPYVRLSWHPPEVTSTWDTYIPVRPDHLKKLNDMLRIAAEASRPRD
jgi:hypothetical protein